MCGFPLGLIDKGSYTIQTVEYSVAPDTITLRGRAANLLDELRALKDRSWHKTTVGSIAAQNMLKVNIDKEIEKRKIGHADQAQESDASFLRRLGRQMDCLCNIKNGTLLFSQVRKARTPSGKELPPVTITRDTGDQHRWARSDRDSYSGVKAFFNNIKPASTLSTSPIAYGRSDIMPQRPVIVSGWKKQIDETVWMVTAVRHSLSSSGCTS